MELNSSSAPDNLAANLISYNRALQISKSKTLPKLSGQRPGEGITLVDLGRKLHRAEMQRLKMKHRAGMTGREIVLARSRLIDLLVRRIYLELFDASFSADSVGAVDTAASKNRESSEAIAIVALGGYGREELSPYSDVDVMLLRDRSLSDKQHQLIQTMLCLLWDIGFQVGHSVRTIKESLQIAQQDFVSQTSMLDGRLICGNENLFLQFSGRFHQSLQKNRHSFVQRFLGSIGDRHASQGGTAFIQEPNIKEAQGGLRDFHSVSWIVKALCPHESVQEVLSKFGISAKEWRKAGDAYEFLLRLRNELHFLTGRRSDVLSHSILNQVVRNFGFRARKHQKASESLLQHYYFQARRVFQVQEIVWGHFKREKHPPLGWISARILKAAGPKSQKPPAIPKVIAVNETPEKWMQRFRYSQAHVSFLNEETRNAIRQNTQHFGGSAFSTPSLAADFRAILRNKGRVAPVIRQMHELGFLGRVLPEFGRLTCLTQHDLYHKYTTDEHTLRALEVLDQIASRREPRHAAYQRVLNEIHDSSTLYFALLMHDTGKGLGKGHSVRGAQLVAKASSRLAFDPDEAEKVQALVRHHLLMGHISQRRDLDDPHTIEEFASHIDRLDILNMLLLMTYADAQAVGPGVWTDWKDHLLWELYTKAYERLMFGEVVGAAGQAEVEAIHEQVADLLETEDDRSTIQKHFDLLPKKYALNTPVAQIAEHIRLAGKLRQEEVALEWVSYPEKGYSDLILVTRDHPGLFAQIAGTVAAFNLNILSAQLNTGEDGIVFDLFQIASQSGHRLHREDYLRVEKLLRKVIAGQVNIERYLRSHYKPGRLGHKAEARSAPKVRIDNEISPSATVIEVQVEDRIGLGYQMAKTLTELQLNIGFAKLATEKAHAFDVFYVQDQKGGKILGSGRMSEIVERLKERLTTSSDGIL